jgi:hypothetical protein
MENKMKFRFDGPMCFVTEIGENGKQVNIVVPRLTKEKNGDFKMNLSEPEDDIQWVTVFINKFDQANVKVSKPIHIECASYDEVIGLVDALQARHGELIKQFRIEKRKPWERVLRLQEEALNANALSAKETTSEVS